MATYCSFSCVCGRPIFRCLHATIFTDVSQLLFHIARKFVDLALQRTINFVNLHSLSSVIHRFVFSPFMFVPYFWDKPVSYFISNFRIAVSSCRVMAHQSILLSTYVSSLAHHSLVFPLLHCFFVINQAAGLFQLLCFVPRNYRLFFVVMLCGVTSFHPGYGANIQCWPE